MQRKRMLEIVNDGTSETVYINSSSLQLMQSCPRKASYICEKLIESAPSSAMQFGTIIHAILARYYLTPVEDRSAERLKDLTAQEFALSNYQATDDVRTYDTAQRIMANYADTMTNDSWKVMLDYSGKPMVEYPIEFELSNDGHNRIRWFGTVDLVVENIETGEIAIMDHKTTRSLGADFINKWNPNHQITGYAMGVGHVLKREIKRGIINGLQVAKTVQRVARIETYRHRDDFNEFTQTVESVVDTYKQYRKRNFYPQSGGSDCSAYGGCQFRDACSTPLSLRGGLLDASRTFEAEVNENA